jgi:putative membrane protein
MIRAYSEHAANERTFLAWVRTGISVIAFGFLIEKFNLFIQAMAISTSAAATHRLQLERLSGPLGRYDGMALIFMGLALIVFQRHDLLAPGDYSMTLSHMPPPACAQS